MPTLRQLEVFVEAARDLNFRSTADRLSISQPAVSRQIQALERELGCKLFDRPRGQTVRLSADGERLLGGARDTLIASRDFVALPGSQPRKFRIGIRHYLLEVHVRQAIPAFLDAHPNLDVEFFVIDNVTDCFAMIEAGEIDFGLYRGDAPASGTLRAQSLNTVALSLFAAPPLYADIGDDLDLSDAPFLSLGRSATEPLQLVTERLEEVGIAPRKVVARTQFPDVLARWCIEGRGVAILFDEEVRQEVAEGRLVRFGPPLRPLNTILLSRQQLPQGSASIIAFLADTLGPKAALEMRVRTPHR